MHRLSQRYHRAQDLDGKHRTAALSSLPIPSYHISDPDTPVYLDGLLDKISI